MVANSTQTRDEKQQAIASLFEHYASIKKSTTTIEEQLVEFGVMEETARVMAHAFTEGMLFEIRTDGGAYVMGEDSDTDFETFRLQSGFGTEDDA
jgi:hypothetical protein